MRESQVRAFRGRLRQRNSLEPESTAFVNRLFRVVQYWSVHRYANRYLCALAFTESIFFPVPTDVVLVPMCVFRPERALYLALMATVFSVLGGMAAYFAGAFAFHWFEGALQAGSWWNHYLEARNWFDDWGGWAIFLAAFTPVPYKVFTVTAGVMNQSIPVFIVASFLGRGMRFFVLAVLSRYLGPKLLPYLQHAPHWSAWVVVGILVAFVLFQLGFSSP